MNPFVKWAGGKRQLMTNEINKSILGSVIKDIKVSTSEIVIEL
jgi:hypothetical protein